MYQPGIVEYHQPPQGPTLPVLFTGLALYPPLYVHQPMAVQLAAYATQTPYYMYPPGIVPGPTVCNTRGVFGRAP